jgi:hypothetical protein
VWVVFIIFDAGAFLPGLTARFLIAQICFAPPMYFCADGDYQPVADYQTFRPLVLEYFQGAPE